MTTNRILATIFLLLIILLTMVPTATAEADHTLHVDGISHSPSKIVGNDANPTVHYNTPDTDPTVAFTERNSWTGNGSEHLPCPNGIHWIDNKNVLTISNCLGGETSTTTTTPTSTTITTVTTVPSSTTSTSPTTTSTTTPTETTTTSTTSTTVPKTTPTTLPKTGLNHSQASGIASLMMLVGLVAVTVATRGRA